MNLLDITLLIVTVAGLILGFRKGIINQIGDVAAIVLGVVACRLLPGKAAMLSDFVAKRWIDDPSCEWITISVGYILLFLIVYTGVRLAAMLLRKISHAAKLDSIDRLCGSLFMAGKCLLALSIILNIWLFLSPDDSITKNCNRQMKPIQELVISFAPSLLGASANNPHMTDIFHPTSPEEMNGRQADGIPVGETPAP